MKKLYSLIFLLTLFYQTSLCQYVWNAVASLPGTQNNEQSGFSANGKGYICGNGNSDLWEYDPAANTWTTRSPFPGPTRNSAVGFSIGTTGYIGTGGNYNDFWAYNALTDTWTQKASFPGSGREGAVGVSINGKGYIGMGGNGYLTDWYEYDPVADTWTQKASLIGPGRYHAVAFSIGNKGYVATGFGNGNFFADVYEYDPTTDTWVQKNNFPGTSRDRAEACSLNGKAYIYFGWSGGSSLSDCWEYNPTSDSWTQLGSIPSGTYNSMGWDLNNSIYGGLGITGSNWYKMEFCLPLNITSQPPLCAGDLNGSAQLTSPSGPALISASWNTIPPVNGPVLSNVAGGSYTITVTDSTGCQSQQTVIITDPPVLGANPSLSQPDCFQDSSGVACINAYGGTGNYQYNWNTGDSVSCIYDIPAGLYTFYLSDANGCSVYDTVFVTDADPILNTISVIAAQCDTCHDGSLTVNPSGGAGSFNILWENGNTNFTLSGIVPGWYNYCVTDYYNCEVCDSAFVGDFSGLKTLTEGQLSVHPSPASSFIDLSGCQPQISMLVITDISGREIIRQAIRPEKGKYRTDISTLSSGTYYLQLSGNNTRQVAKFMRH